LRTGQDYLGHRDAKHTAHYTRWVVRETWTQGRLNIRGPEAL